MLKKTITYTNFNDEEVSEDFYFHLSKAELIELEMSHKGGLSEALKKIIESEDGKGIIEEFKKIILGAYGKRSDDGRLFTKTQELREEFESTEAYSALFMELVTNTDSAIEFVNGVIPKGMAEEAAKVAEAAKNLEAPTPIVPVPEPKIVTRVDLQMMSSEDINQLGPRIAAGEVILQDEETPSQT